MRERSSNFFLLLDLLHFFFSLSTTATLISFFFCVTRLSLEKKTMVSAFSPRSLPMHERDLSLASDEEQRELRFEKKREQEGAILLLLSVVVATMRAIEFYSVRFFFSLFPCLVFLDFASSAWMTSLNLHLTRRKARFLTHSIQKKTSKSANCLPPRRRLGPPRDDQARPRRSSRRRRRLARPLRGAEAGDTVSIAGRERERERERERGGEANSLFVVIDNAESESETEKLDVFFSLERAAVAAPPNNTTTNKTPPARPLTSSTPTARAPSTPRSARWPCGERNK